MNILQTLESRGFRMYASINQSSEEIEQMDTWYVCRPQGWSLGQVVYGDLFPTATPYGSDSKPGGYMREPAPGGYGGVPGGYGGGTPGGYHPPAPAPAPQVFPQAPYGSPPPPGGVPYGAPTKFPTHAAHGLESYACVTMNEECVATIPALIIQHLTTGSAVIFSGSSSLAKQTPTKFVVVCLLFTTLLLAR